MSTYRKIHGRSIQAVTTDPSESVAEGQVWYNTTSDTFKSVLIGEAFSSSAPVLKNTYRAGSAGIQTAALLFGGSTASPFTFFADTQEYNGSGFSSGGALAQARWGLRGAGTQTAGLGFAGYIGPPGPPSKNSALTEEYDGTSWTSGGAMGTGRYALGGAGSQTSALAFGGHIYPTSPGNQTANEEYDGSSWTAGGALPSARTRLSGCGPSNNDALAVGHQTSGVCSTYNGTAWTDTGSLGTARYRGGSSGSTSSAITYGGSTHPGVNNVTATENFDGSSWSTSPATMGTARYAFGYAGVVDSALAMSGYSTALTGITEEYNKSVNVITGAAWSSSGNIPIPVRGGASGGTKTAAWLTGGLGPGGPSDKDNTYLYDGSAWTAGNDLPNNYFIGGGTGPATAGLVWDGMTAGGGPGTTTYEFDGTNWTSASTFPAIGPGGSQGSTGAGVGQTAAVALGGVGDPPPAQSSRMIAYDGSSWSADESMPAGVSGCAADGPNTAIWIAGGYSNPDTTSTSSQEYDGSSWTTTGSLVSAAPQGLQFQGWGPQTSAILAGGSSGGAPNNHNCQQYNGTIWATAASLATGRNNHAFCSKTAGTQAGFVAGGYEDSGNTNATEEFTGETSAANIADFTTS